VHLTEIMKKITTVVVRVGVMTVQSVNRAIDILSLFSPTRPVLGITDISRALHLPKPTVHGLVKTLTGRGFLQRDSETRKYRLGLNIYEMSTILAGTMPINQAGAGPIQRLSQETGMIVRLAMWDNKNMLVTLSLFPDTEATQFQNLGPRVPPYCSAVGKAVLAVMPKKELNDYLSGVRYIGYTPNTLTTRKALVKDIETTRRRGYSVDRGEYLAGIACIGAPIYDRYNKAIGSVSLSGSPRKVLKSNVDEKAQQLIEVAAEISRNLGYLPDTKAI
jgi:DNA-binding IclR family transcriptional regulator